MKKLKKIGVVFILLLAVTTLKPALAQAPGVTSSIPPLPNTLPTSNPQASPQSQSSNLDVIYGNVDPNVPRNLHTLTQSTIIEVLSGTICALSGRDPLNPKGTCLGYDPKSGKIGYASQSSGGVAQVIGGFIGSTMSIPISSGDYARYAVSNFGIAKNAYAQGTSPGPGFAYLSPLISVWAKFRDISYLAFVLAFTIIGLAIMFRVKIDARTVMTIQNQIPKIVVALILVTFSYAIAGFLIDMMYVIMYLVLLTFNSVHVNPNASVFSVVNQTFNPSYLNATHYMPGGGVMNLTFQMSRGIGSTFSNLTTDFLSSTMSPLFKILFLPFKALELGCDVFSGLLSWGTVPGWLQKIPGIGDLLGHIPGFDSIFGGSTCNFADTLFSGFFAFLFGAIAFLVVLIAIIYTLFSVWFTLIKSFIYVLVDAIMGPLWITAGIFPGSKLGFGTWVRHLMAHLSVFPMTFGVILLGKTIMDGVGGSSGGQLFNPPLVGDAIGGNQFLASIIGFGFILSLPSILDRTRKAIGAIDFGLTDVRKSFTAGAAGPQKGFGEYNKMRQESLKYEITDQGPKKLSMGQLISRRLPWTTKT